MLRRPRPNIVAFVCLTVLLMTTAAPLWAWQRGGGEARPNVLLIMTDDQGFGDIHSHGNEMIDTPVMDKLAHDGARFERFFVSPVCAPTRACLLTGRYYSRTGVHGVTRGYETMRAGERTMAELFKQAGYATGCFGKWHNGAHYPQHPNGQGFDEFVGFCAGHWNNYFNTHLEHNGTPIQTKGFITDVLTDAAIAFIDEHRAGPFLCYVPYNAPHSPWQAPDRYFDKYKARGLDDTTACAYAMVENLDDNIGRLLARLDALKLADHTIVLFLTDNGVNSDRFNAGMKGRKGSVDEGGVRVPLFVRWPGHVKAGAVVRPIAAHIDLLPTLAAMCGVALPNDLALDGVSLAPLLIDDPKAPGIEWPDRTLFSRWGNRGAARTQRWRAVNAGKADRWRLYDMLADPGQKHDVAGDHPDVTARLSAAYAANLKDVSKAGFDPIATEIGHPQRSTVVLPGHEAFLQPRQGEGISYHGRAGWANDWVTNWTSTQAYPTWPIDVVRSGRYEITLHYVCAKANVGARVRVEVGGRGVDGVVTQAHDPKPVFSPDRVPRKEVYEMHWAPLTLGVIQLPRGRATLAVKALSKPGEQVMDLKSVTLRRVD